ncbi:uncharacterized protein LOC133351640 [Lethenteron reissneri]|uniref:uncharacterized protein LOC133351640 n=1 Tax=Lethenteron reissneri TaxID=7753 RepID=UPI002AB6CD5E|nr:uncharacterized protein LOC133351640 [Lethenteron reissneri]
MAGGSPVAGQQQPPPWGSSAPGKGGSGGGAVLRAVESISDLYRTPSFFLQRARAARARGNSNADATVATDSSTAKPPPRMGGSAQWTAAAPLFNDEDDWEPAWKDLPIPPLTPSPPSQPPQPPHCLEDSSSVQRPASCCPCSVRLLLYLLLLVSLLSLAVAACALYWAVMAHNETRGLRGTVEARAMEAERLGAHDPSNAAEGLHLPGHPRGLRAPAGGVW